ncbi:MAG TPA: flagellar basal body-associated FliL family protein [Lacipirellulaceae bacterium]|jgi:flagellar basal body-associated protein FliL|nr:flagellar basal body-associated FliL family protein [Lacipirellulaceae bacterium]
MSNRRYSVIAVAAFGCAMLGCSSKSTFKFDQMDLLPAEEELTEIPLGEYKIPIPIPDDGNAENLSRHNRVQFDFDLYALVSPKEESQFKDAWDRHEGVIRDEVISICRSATVDELQEAELATLKARLTDALGAELGEQRLRQLLITDVVSQPL